MLSSVGLAFLRVQCVLFIVFAGNIFNLCSFADYGRFKKILSRPGVRPRRHLSLHVKASLGK